MAIYDDLYAGQHHQLHSDLYHPQHRWLQTGTHTHTHAHTSLWISHHRWVTSGNHSNSKMERELWRVCGVHIGTMFKNVWLYATLIGMIWICRVCLCNNLHQALEWKRNCYQWIRTYAWLRATLELWVLSQQWRLFLANASIRGGLGCSAVTVSFVT